MRGWRTHNDSLLELNDSLVSVDSIDSFDNEACIIELEKPQACMKYSLWWFGYHLFCSDLFGSGSLSGSTSSLPFWFSASLFLFSKYWTIGKNTRWKMMWTLFWRKKVTQNLLDVTAHRHQNHWRWQILSGDLTDEQINIASCLSATTKINALA